jgi:hypothetical protein
MTEIARNKEKDRLVENIFNIVDAVEKKAGSKPVSSRPSRTVMGGHGEGPQRPCGDQPEMSVRRGQPQASDGRRLVQDFV